MNATEREIRSQPAVWRHALTDADLLGSARDVLAAPGERVLAFGCGTSWFVAQSYAVLRERAGFGETDAACASEAATARPYDRVVAFSRSGTTTEVLDALSLMPSGTRRCVVTAVADTPIATVCDTTLVLGFADEESVVQ